MSNWTRPYYQEDPGLPSLHYVAFGDVFTMEESEEVLALLPIDIKVEVIEAELVRQGPHWNRLRESDSNLADIIEKQAKATVFRGELPPQADLEYLRVVLDALTYMVDSGTLAVYDPFTSRWWDAVSWDEMATAGQVFSPFDHCVVVSKGESAKTMWLHTKGLLKFGRPDLSVREVKVEQVEAISRMLHRFMNFQALGGVVEKEREIEMDGLEQTYVPAAVSGTLQEPLYENVMLELQVAP